MYMNTLDDGSSSSGPRASFPGRSQDKASTDAAAGTWLRAACDLPLPQLARIRRGYFGGRSPDITMVPRKPNFFGTFEVTSHAGPWGYLQRVPLVFYGPGFIKSQGTIRPSRPATLADLAPTLAELLDTPFPEDRGGRPITEALVPESRRSRDLRMVLTVVWDGGGWNVLEKWPGAWPHLKGLIRGGTSISNVTVGSSPSVTPAIHSTIGTGAWPEQHAIVDIWMRNGDKVVEAFGDMSPRYLKLQTLADLYDRANDNEPKVGMLAEKGWHLGMLGSGAYRPGADRDVAVMWTPDQRLITNRDWYSLPPYLARTPDLSAEIGRVDAADGNLDLSWRGHRVLNDRSTLRLSPVWTLYQPRLLKEILSRGRYGSDAVPDLFFTNFKEIDVLGHVWNMLNPEIRDTLRYSDRGLAEITAFLNEHVGKGRWVLAFTADHGQTPDPRATDAWPIAIEALEVDLASHFGMPVSTLFEARRPTGFWLNRTAMARNGVTDGAISDFVVAYRLKDNVESGGTIPPGYRERARERLFAAAFPTDQIGEIWDCATSR